MSSGDLDQLAELQRQLAARDKTIAVLIQRQLDVRARETSTLHFLEQNITLEKVVEHKTRELALERAELQRTLAELKQTQARMLQMQKMESIGQLAAGIAHEINTPTQFVADNITFLRSTLEPLLALIDASLVLVGKMRETPFHAEQLTDFDSLRDAADLEFVREQAPLALAQCSEGLSRIAGIVKAMKTFSHASSGVLEPEDLGDILRSALTVSQSEWKHVADVELAIDPDLPAVACLRDEIGQVVMNLVINAAHAIGDQIERGKLARGRIELSVRVQGDHVELRVADDGTGIPEDIRERVFEPFFTTKAVGRGSGQGLALAYSTLVERHKGEIHLEPRDGGGTCIVARWPIRA
ncbi:MAG: ATP-binding protein [Holophaga sp.]|nr:ATP-binding protein [Holophaga sp.]